MKKRNLAGFTLIELMIVVAIIGILAAIAIPNFIKFQARSKQTEAKANLKSLYTAQRSFFQEHDNYGTFMSGVGFQPERGNRYSYAMGPAGGVQQIRTAATLLTTGNGGSYNEVQVDTYKFTGASLVYVPKGVVTYINAAGELSLGSSTATVLTGAGGGFAAFAAGNVDNETAGIDTWQIGSQSGTLTTNNCSDTDTTFVSGSPVMTYSDVACD